MFIAGKLDLVVRVYLTLESEHLELAMLREG